MKNTPAGWPRLSVSVVYKDPGKAIDWLCEAFGFECQVKIEEGGRIVHSQIVYGEALMMVGDEAVNEKRGGKAFRKSPASIDGFNTQSIMIFVDDVDAHAEHAKKAGATIAWPPTTTDYGAEWWTDRSYEAIDLEGHHWWFVQRLRDQPSAKK